MALTRVQTVNLSVLVGVETARGSAVKNHNLGNITAGASYSGKAWRPPWFDEAEAARDPKLMSLHKLMLEGKAPSAFRAYETLADGADDFARTLATSFPEVLSQAREPDADEFREALGRKYSHDYATHSEVTETIRKLQTELGFSGAAFASGSAVLLGLLYLLWRVTRK